MSIENNYNISFVAELALREKQIQQAYRPIIAVHKWFARRPGTLFRSLLLSEFGNRPIHEIYYDSHNFPEKAIADCFMGGGTPIIEANRIGCATIGLDINPMATWVVREEIDSIDLIEYQDTCNRITETIERQIGHLYQTTCPLTGKTDAVWKYSLWVKVTTCEVCNHDYDLTRTYLVADNTRHPSYVISCHHCGELNEVDSPKTLGFCKCGVQLKLDGTIKRNLATCPHCGSTSKQPNNKNHPPKHRLFAIEYFNPSITDRAGRLFKKPDARDMELANQAKEMLENFSPCFIPEDSIPEGDETARLLKWGYSKFHQLFNHRQLLSLEILARLISTIENKRIQRALATNFSDLIRYQNMLCRYDTMALKSLDIFSIHGFPTSYVQCESNFMGIKNKNGTPVGSGGLFNIIEKYKKAKSYCTTPFEIKFNKKKKTTVFIKGEWIGEYDKSKHCNRNVDLRCESALSVNLQASSVDAILTDPPYYGMVQYGELMHFLYIWLRKLMGSDFPGFNQSTTKSPDELTGNNTEGRGIAYFAEGLSAVYSRMAEALKPEAPLAFTFHHNTQEAYLAVAMAILDSGLICTAALPCPAEMGGSIHISGTGSSIIDTVFVCRRQNLACTVKKPNSTNLRDLLENDIAQLKIAGVKPTLGDIRCIFYGHLTKMIIENLSPEWKKATPTDEKLDQIKIIMNKMADKMPVTTLSILV